MLAKISKDVDEFRRTGKIPCFTEDQSSDSDDLGKQENSFNQTSSSSITVS